MRACVQMVGVAGFCALAGAVTAQDWQSGEAGRGAWAMIDADGFRLDITCWPNEARFFFTLSGGPFAGMNNIDDGNESMMLWMQMPDGRTARHPIDGYYFAPDKTFVGRFVVTDFVLNEFRNGAEMWLTAPTGDEIVRFPMTGTGKARGHFRQACGI